MMLDVRVPRGLLVRYEVTSGERPFARIVFADRYSRLNILFEYHVAKTINYTMTMTMT